MKKKISVISIVVISLLTACTTPITNLNPAKVTSSTNIKVKTSISGKAIFSESNSIGSLKTKATLADIGTNATIALIYPSDNPTNANKTIATGLTDIFGFFTINPELSFSPNVGEVFVLEASKRLGDSGKALLSIRTFIRWSETGWDSITTPDLLITKKTTALAGMASLLAPNVSSSDTIGKISTVNNLETTLDVTHLGSVVISANSINNVANLINQALLKNYDPLQYLIYQDGYFTLKDPNDITNLISTIAGTGIVDAFYGNMSNFYTGDGGQASNAKLSIPLDIKFDSLDNMYILLREKGLVKKVDKQTGIISTIAGTGNSDIYGDGFYNGDGVLATDAQLNYPRGINFDSLDNLYIVDTNNQRIRKIDKTTGIISTVAGSNDKGYSGDGGLATNAKLNTPENIAFDSLDNMYIADTLNSKIRKVDKTTGIISTVAGSGYVNNFGAGYGKGYSGDGGFATNAKLNNPLDIKFDSLDNMYIVDSDNYRIRKVNKITGIISTVAGGSFGYNGDGGLATNASFNSSSDISFDSLDNMYIVDYGNNRIRKVDKSTGITTTVAGNWTYGYFGDGGLATNAQLNYPRGISFDSNNNIYIVDSNNYRIRKINKTTNIISTVVGGGFENNINATDAVLSNQTPISLDSIGNIYLTDNQNPRIRKIDKNTGIITTVVGTGIAGFSGDGGQATNAKLYNPSGTAFDSNGNMYITDTINHRIRKVDKITGIISTIAGNSTITSVPSNSDFSGDGGLAINAHLNSPKDVIFDSLGNIYIVDTYNHRIRKVDKVTGVISTVVGNGIQSYTGDGGQASLAQLNYPQAIKFDSLGNMYIVDTSNSRIRKVDKNTGIISTIAGIGTSYQDVGFSGDGGLATNARLNSPIGISFDSIGNLYINDNGNNRIRKIDKITGIISTFIGNGLISYNGNSIASEKANLKNPTSIVFDSFDNLYVADSGNGKLIKVNFTQKYKP